MIIIRRSNVSIDILTFRQTHMGVPLPNLLSRKAVLPISNKCVKMHTTIGAMNQAKQILPRPKGSDFKQG